MRCRSLTTPALLGVLAAAVCLLGSACASPEDAASEPIGTSSTQTTFPFSIPGDGAGDFEETEVELGTDPYVVDGTIRLPVDATEAAPVPGAVIIGDFGAQDQDGTVLGRKPLRDLGEGLAERGVATLTYDKRTLAYQDELGGDATVDLRAELLDDAVSAVELLRGTDGVDPERVFVVGHGVGGSLAPRVNVASGGLAGLVELAAPARPFQRVLADETAYLANFDGVLDAEEQQRLDLVTSQAAHIEDPALRPDVAPGDLLGASGAWWLDVQGYRPAPAAVNAAIPVLVVMAGRDYRAIQPDIDEWNAAATNGSELVRVKVIDGLDHLLVAGEGPSHSDDYASADKVDAEVLDTVAAFIANPQR